MGHISQARTYLFGPPVCIAPIDARSDTDQHFSHQAAGCNNWDRLFRQTSCIYTGTLLDGMPLAYRFLQRLVLQASYHNPPSLHVCCWIPCDRHYPFLQPFTLQPPYVPPEPFRVRCRLRAVDFFFSLSNANATVYRDKETSAGISWGLLRGSCTMMNWILSRGFGKAGCQVLSMYLMVDERLFHTRMSLFVVEEPADPTFP